MLDFYQTSNLLPRESKKYERFKEWVVFSHGQIIRNPDDETYSCKIWFAPTDWKNIWPSLKDDDKKDYLISGEIPIDFLGGITCGTILSTTKDVIGKEALSRLVIPVENPSKLKIDKISSLISEDLFSQTPYSPYQGSLPCIRISFYNGEKTTLCIIPCFEIARFYFFKGNKITRCILNNTYHDEYEFPADLKTNEATGHKTAYLKIKQGYLKHERIVFGELALSEKMREATQLIYNSLASDRSYFKTRFFSDNPFKIGALGHYLDNDKSVFIVSQIHQTSEELPFNTLECEKLGGRSSNGKLRQPFKKGNNSKKLIQINPSPNSPPSIDMVKAPSASSPSAKFPLFNKVEDFFQKPEIEVIQTKNSDQDLQPKGVAQLINMLSNTFSVKKHGTSGSLVGKAELEFISQVKNDSENFVFALGKALEKRGFTVSYFDINNDFTFFHSEEQAIQIFNYEFMVLQLKDELGNYFYLFEKITYPYGYTRTALFNYDDKRAFEKSTIETILNFAQSSNDWYNYKQDEKIKALEINSLRGFNHYHEGNLIPAEDFAQKIANYIQGKVKTKGKL